MGCRINSSAPTGDVYYPGLVPADEELWFRPKFPKPSAPDGDCFDRVLAPEGEVLSCRDKKVPKETLPRTLRPAWVLPMRGPLARSLPQWVRARAFLRARCPCFARKTGAPRPWCARAPGRGFTGSPPFIRLAPVPGPDARCPYRAPSGLRFGCAPHSA